MTGPRSCAAYRRSTVILGNNSRRTFTYAVASATASSLSRRRLAIAGFYTLSATSLLLTSIPDDQARRLPRYTLRAWVTRYPRRPAVGGTASRPS
jgi:hypothetical protein